MGVKKRAALTTKNVLRCWRNTVKEQGERYKVKGKGKRHREKIEKREESFFVYHFSF